MFLGLVDIKQYLVCYNQFTLDINMRSNNYCTQKYTAI